MTKENVDKRKVGDVLISEMMNEPDRFIVWDKTDKRICTKCHKPFTLNANENRTTLRCGCGCRIIYPPNEYDVRMVTYVSREEYVRGYKNGGRKKIK